MPAASGRRALPSPMLAGAALCRQTALKEASEYDRRACRRGCLLLTRPPEGSAVL